MAGKGELKWKCTWFLLSGFRLEVGGRALASVVSSLVYKGEALCRRPATPRCRLRDRSGEESSSNEGVKKAYSSSGFFGEKI